MSEVKVTWSQSAKTYAGDRVAGVSLHFVEWPASSCFFFVFRLVSYAWKLTARSKEVFLTIKVRINCLMVKIIRFCYVPSLFLRFKSYLYVSMLRTVYVISCFVCHLTMYCLMWIVNVIFISVGAKFSCIQSSDVDPSVFMYVFWA